MDKQDKQEPGYFEQTGQMFEEYVRNRLMLLKLRATEKTARLASLLVIFLVLMMLAFLILLFISMMAGYYFAEVTGSLFYGFGIVALIYVVLFVIVFLLRKKYFDPFITNTIVRVFFDKTADDEQSEGIK